MNKRTFIELVLLSCLFFLIMYVTLDSINKRDRFYHITTNRSIYYTKEVLVDSNKCIIFVDHRTNKKITACGDYEIKNPKNNGLED